MKAVVKLVDGTEYTLTDGLADDLYRHLTKGTGPAIPLGWVSNMAVAINFNHAISVVFDKEAE